MAEENLMNEVLKSTIAGIGTLTYKSAVFFLVFLAIIVSLLYVAFFAETALDIIRNFLEMALSFIP